MAIYDNVMVPWPGWHIVDEIGEGGYGTTYEIERTQSGITEQAALKVISVPKDRGEYDSVEYTLRTTQKADEYFRKKKDEFLNEIKTMQSLKGSPNIVDIDDWTVTEREDGLGWIIYIRMERLGSFFEKYSDINTSDEDVIELGKDICTALKQCEKRGIIHRDIKPGNILVNEDGDHKLADFGIARTLDHTTYATKAGSANYMAPEVYNGGKTGNTVDIYSLGIVMYELLNRHRPPFSNVGGKISPLEERQAFQTRMSGEQPVPEPVSGSRELKRIVLKACAYDPKDRYRSAVDMLKDLKNISVSGHPYESEKSVREIREDNRANNGGEMWEDASKTVGAEQLLSRNKKQNNEDLHKTMGSGEHRKKDRASEGASKDSKEKEKKKDGKSKTAVIIAVIIALAALAGVIIWAMGSGDTEVTDPPAEDTYDEPAGDTEADINYGLPLSAGASSQHEDMKGINYAPENVLDGDLSTAWVEGAKGDGSGEWISAEFRTDGTMKAMYIRNGYQKSQEVYTTNNRVKDAHIVFEDGSAEYFTLEDNGYSPQAVVFSEEKKGSSFRLVIDSVYPSEDELDACITEMGLISNDPEDFAIVIYSQKAW